MGAEGRRRGAITAAKHHLHICPHGSGAAGAQHSPVQTDSRKTHRRGRLLGAWLKVLHSLQGAGESSVDIAAAPLGSASQVMLENTMNDERLIPKRMKVLLGLCWCLVRAAYQQDH